MKKQHVPSLMLLLALLAIGFAAQAQTGGKNMGRSNTSNCCRNQWRPIPPPGAASAQERRAPQPPVALFGGNKSAAKLDVWILDANGLAVDPSRWSLRNEGEAMVVDFSTLPAAKYTIQMQAGNSLDEYEIGTDGVAKLVAVWEKVDDVAGMKATCYPSLISVPDCSACLKSDDDCLDFISTWHRGKTQAQNRIANSSVQLKQNPKKKLGQEVLRTVPPGDKEIYIIQCDQGVFERVARMSDCPEGCTVSIYKRKKGKKKGLPANNEAIFPKSFMPEKVKKSAR